MIAEDMLTQAQQRCIPDVSFELIPIRNLVSNQEYQRPLSENHIRKALEEFDVYQINPVKVSRRDGINYVFDGQHTIEIIASESGSRDTPVWCMIYDDLKYKEEAHIFADQQKHVKALSSFETFKAHIEADDPKQKMIEGLAIEDGTICWSSLYEDSAYGVVAGDNGIAREWTIIFRFRILIIVLRLSGRNVPGYGSRCRHRLRSRCLLRRLFRFHGLFRLRRLFRSCRLFWFCRLFRFRCPFRVTAGYGHCCFQPCLSALRRHGILQ